MRRTWISSLAPASLVLLWVPRVSLNAPTTVASLAALALLASMTACKHASPKIFVASDNEYRLHQLVPYTLRVRRPEGPGADPKAGPGGADYRSHPLPDAHFDCQTSSGLFRDLKLREIRECLSAQKTPLRFQYRVKWLTTPVLELESKAEIPECWAKFLPKIPTPREIFFQSTEGGRLACYSSRLAIESDEVADLKLPIHKTAVRVELPLEKPPQTDDEMRALLLSWVLTPFFDRDSDTIFSHLVPDAICLTCLGDATMLKATDPEPLLWPIQGHVETR